MDSNDYESGNNRELDFLCLYVGEEIKTYLYCSGWTHTSDADKTGLLF